MQDKLSLTVKPVYVVQDHATGKMTFGITRIEAIQLQRDLQLLLNAINAEWRSYVEAGDTAETVTNDPPSYMWG